MSHWDIPREARDALLEYLHSGAYEQAARACIADEPEFYASRRLLVIDDRLLFEVVVESEDDAVGSFREAGDRGELYTTGYWYWRLARAIAHPIGGALSGPFRGLPEELQRRVTVAMADLPASIGMLPLRRLVPIMAALPGQVNALTEEAVATAIAVDGAVVVTTESDMLRRVATAAIVPVEVVRLGR